MPNEILVFAEHHGGKLTRAAWEALAAGQHLAQGLGTSIVAVLLGNGLDALARDLASASLQEVLIVDSPLLTDYTADGYAIALRGVIERQQPLYTVFSHTYQVRDFAPKVAVSMGRGLVSDCLGYRNEAGKIIFIRQIFQGKFCADVELVGEAPYFVSFQAAAFRGDSVQRGEIPAPINVIPVSLAADAIRVRPEERFRETRQSMDLTQAEQIVAVGRGIKTPDKMDLAQKLADALGAELGASRPICDNGWLPMDRQIGSSGQTVSPELYVALGISGAIQHMVGMKGSRVVVAINKDKEAPIFEVATYGIVGDLFEIVPLLIEEIEKMKG